MFICKTETDRVLTEPKLENQSTVNERPLDQLFGIGSVDFLRQWSLKLAIDLPEESENTRQSILQWLMGPNPERFDEANDPEQLVLARSLNYRYQVLRDRYWQVAPARAYQTLIQHLCSSSLVCNKIRTWIVLSGDRRRTVTDLLQEVIQDMLQRDRDLREQVRWIGECSSRQQIRNWLMLATIEEYCLRPVHNQPLLVHRCTSYLQRL